MEVEVHGDGAANAHLHSRLGRELGLDCYFGLGGSHARLRCTIGVIPRLLNRPGVSKLN